MSELSQRMDDAMVMRGFADRTRETYLMCVRSLAKHYWLSPDKLDSPQLQAYLLHLINEKKLAYASVNQANCAIRFLFEKVLRRSSIRLDIPMAKVPQRLPQIQEVAVIPFPHPKLGEEAAACIVFRPGAALDAERLEAHCIQWLADYAVPRHWFILESLPRNPMGKVLKRELPALIARLDSATDSSRC